MGLLTKMGIWGGEDYRTGPNNPCYYEDRTLFDWVNGKATAQEVVDKLAVKPKWGMKHPRIAERWSEFENLIPEAKFIITHRLNFKAQVRSHQSAIRKQSSDEVAERNKLYYRATDLLREDYDTLDVFYEDFFVNQKTLSQLAQFCGVEVTQEARDLIDPSLRSDL
jgi:hypothetical protein